MIHNPVCKTYDIEDPGSKSFELKIRRKTRSIFVVKKNGDFFAYRNRCPHTGANLEWQENQFLDLDKELIQCATHDALFQIDSGKCIAGPCVGKYLESIELHIKDDTIYLDI